jgi:hypothetical protein
MLCLILTSEYFLLFDDLVNRPWRRKEENMSKAYAFEAAFLRNAMVKLIRAHGGCLGTRSRRRTWRTTILPRGAVSKL